MEKIFRRAEISINVSKFRVADANASVRVAQGPTRLAHVRSLCPSKRSIIRIQIGRGGDESAVHLMRLQALNA